MLLKDKNIICFKNIIITSQFLSETHLVVHVLLKHLNFNPIND